MARQKRSDSVEAAVSNYKDAHTSVKPPPFVKLRAADKPFWESITRARKDWTDHDLVQAANLARAYADIEKLQKRLDKEGHVVQNQRGTQITNPIHGALEQLTRRAIALSRIIQVHAQATQGDSRDQKKKNAAKNAAAAAVAVEDEDDGLLARAH